jgi:hypothetical protein
VSPNYYRHNRSGKSEQSHLTSIQKEEPASLNPSGEHMENLKSSEKAKWEQVIDFVSANLKGTINNEKTKEMMSAILDFSVKNREELNKVPRQVHSSVPSTIIDREEDEEEAQLEVERCLNFKKKSRAK